MNRISRHISVKDLRKTRQRQIGEQKERAAQKLKEWQEAERKQIEEAAKPYKSNWRKELQESEWFPIPGSGPTNSASQSFEYGGEGGPQFTANGLGGQDVYPQTIDFFGDPIPTPSYSDVALQGYTQPLSKEVMKRNKDAEEFRKKQDENLQKIKDTLESLGTSWEEMRANNWAIVKPDGISIMLGPITPGNKQLNWIDNSKITVGKKHRNAGPNQNPFKVRNPDGSITIEFSEIKSVKKFEIGEKSSVNAQLDASQDYTVEIDADAFMNARVQDTPDASSFNYDPSKTPFGADYGEVSQVIDGEKLLPQELQDILNRRRGKSPALGGTFTKDEKRKIADFMATKDGYDLLIKDPDTYDRLERALMGRIPPRNLYPGKTSQPKDYYGDFLRGGGMIDPSAYGRVFNTTVPGVKNYNPGYVPYPNPNNYKPVSAGEKAYVRSLQILPGLVNVVSTILGNDEGSAATPADWALQYARGDYTPITKSPGRAFNQNTMELISIALDSPNTPRGSVKAHTYNDRNSFDSIRDTSIRNSLGQFNYRVTANGIEIKDTFNFSGNTSIGALAAVDDIIGTSTFGVVDQPIQRNADKLVDIGYRSALQKGQNPADDKHGIPIKYTIPWSEVPAKLQNKLDPTQTISPIVKRNRRSRKVVESTFNKLKKHR